MLQGAHAGFALVGPPFGPSTDRYEPVGVPFWASGEPQHYGGKEKDEREEEYQQDQKQWIMQTTLLLPFDTDLGAD